MSGGSRGTVPGATPGAAPGRCGIGLHYGPTDLSMPVVDLAVEAEARGFDAVFVPEHTHIPVSRATPYFGGHEMPDRYRRLLDPLVALSFVAARTRLVVGTCVALPAEHDAIAYAKAVASLDRLSGGRLVLGVGAGWNREEAADHGCAPRDRWEVVAESVALMKELWTKEVGSFAGRHRGVAPSWAWPKPAQRPHPPVLVGGRAGAATFARVAAWADGWLPMGMDLAASLPGDLARLRGLWCDAGRDPDHLHVTVMARPDPDRLRADLPAYRPAGVTRVLVDVPSAPADVVLPLLDRLAPLTTENPPDPGRL